MKCQVCKAVELSPEEMSKEWSTDEHGAPIEVQVGTCASCILISEQKAAEEIEADKARIDAAINQNLSSVAVSTTESVPSKEIVRFLGPVRGGTVRAKHVGRDIAAGLKNVVGGEIRGYTELLAEAREEAIHRMKLDAERLGGNAVIGFRFSTATIDTGVAEITAYGTAVITRDQEIE